MVVVAFLWHGRYGRGKVISPPPPLSLKDLPISIATVHI
jgi:hypothetical protein